MTDYSFVQIDSPDIPELTGTLNGDSVFLVSIANQTYRLKLSTLFQNVLNDSNLTGSPQVTTPPDVSSQRAVNTAYVISKLAGAGLGVATPTTTGTVKINSSAADPVVYLKSEVDTLNAVIRSVALGGTGANNAASARANLGAAASGANADITSLSGLTTTPQAVRDTINGHLPIGTIIQWLDGTIPTGWLALNGQSLSRTAYAALFALYGTKYGNGAGDGLTFSLPNLVDRFAVGAHPTVTSDLGGTVLPGDRAGANQYQLSVAQLPTHTHTHTFGTAGSHTHTVTNANAGSHTHTAGTDAAGSHTHEVPGQLAADSGTTRRQLTAVTADSTVTTQAAGLHGHTITVNPVSDHTHTTTVSTDTGHTHSLTIDSTGSNVLIDNRPRYFGIQFLVKAVNL
jgi:microcystin-dependent protein